MLVNETLLFVRDIRQLLGYDLAVISNHAASSYACETFTGMLVGVGRPAPVTHRAGLHQKGRRRP